MADDSGLSEFNASIDAMTKRLSAALPDIVMSAAEIVENEIKARAPKDTGALITALEIAASRRKASASATVQVKDSSKGGVEHYAIFVEYGTSNSPAHPFFRPGVQAAASKVEAYLHQQIIDNVESYDR